MKKTIFYFVFWVIFADIANYTESKILLGISCLIGIFMMIYIIKRYSNNE